MIRLRFNDVEEYLAELRRDADASSVERRIVRVTRLFRPSSQLPNIQRASAVSTYVKAAVYPESIGEQGEPERAVLVSTGADPQLVYYESPTLGEFGWRDELDAAVSEKLDGLLDQITAYARSLGLDACPGLLESELTR